MSLTWGELAVVSYMKATWRSAGEVRSVYVTQLVREMRVALVKGLPAVRVERGLAKGRVMRGLARTGARETRWRRVRRKRMALMVGDVRCACVVWWL